MTTNQKAAQMIRSLMRDLRVSDHVVFPGHKSDQPKPPAIVASALLRELEAE